MTVWPSGGTVPANEALGRFGSPACIDDLVPLTTGFFRAGSIKDLAEHAIEAIKARSVRGAAGGLSVARVTDGNVSLTNEENGQP